MEMQTKIEDYQRIEKAIQFLAENYHHQPSLDEVARSVNLSEFLPAALSPLGGHQSHALCAVFDTGTCQASAGGIPKRAGRYL